MKVPKPRRLNSGTWFIQLRLGGKSIPITASSEGECKRQAGLAKAEYLAGKRAPEPEIETEPEKLPTLGEAVDAYISARSNILSPATIRGYKTIRKNRFQDLMGTSLSDLSDADWVLACNREAALCSAKTLTNAWRFLASVIRRTAGREPPQVTLPQVVPNEVEFLEPDQVQVFIRAVKGTQAQIPTLLALSSLRRSEICALRWENVDLKKGRILVKGAAVFDEHQKLVRKNENKNRSSTRYVPIMIPELADALKQQKKAEGLVVTCHPNTILDWAKDICRKNGLPEVGTHGLRHSFASLAYSLGVPEKITMEIGGWADSQTMRRIYTHVAKKDVKRYETKLSEFFQNANENANT